MAKLGHRWRLETWRQKYEARLRVYGAEKCRIAVDGFCAQVWYVAYHSQDAPDLIFRNDRQFEKFLARGLKQPAHSEEGRKKNMDSVSKTKAMLNYRVELAEKNAELTRRFFQKIEASREDINEHSWNAWIEDLLVVGVKKGEVILFSMYADFVQEHYGEFLREALGGVKVTVVDGPPSPLSEPRFMGFKDYHDWKRA